MDKTDTPTQAWLEKALQGWGYVSPITKYNRMSSPDMDKPDTLTLDRLDRKDQDMDKTDTPTQAWLEKALQGWGYVSPITKYNRMSSPDMDKPDTLTLDRLDRKDQDMDKTDTPTQAWLEKALQGWGYVSPITKYNRMSSPDMDKPDTLTLDRLDRKDQGPWETEYSYGTEADLYRHYNNCVKNPGHKNFIPVDEFSIEDLPEDYRDNDVFDYIRAVSELTVRVTVKYVSDKRPAVIPGSRHPYPHYSVRGLRRMTVGTGWVEHVGISRGSKCPCEECRNSLVGKTNFGVISIRTSSHVVFDNLEGEHTTCHLFFDRGNSPDTCFGVVTLTGMCDVTRRLRYDLCDMKHFTHDLDLLYRLHNTLKKMTTLRDTIFKKTLLSYRINERPNVADNQLHQPLLLVIVSHPHGCSKQISLGQWAGMEFDEDNIIAILYTTATCPGSSGALVCLPQAVTIPHIDVAFFTFRASHSGTSRDKDGINFCHVDLDVPMLQMFSLDRLQMGEGPWKDILCDVEENYPHKHFRSRCENPGQESDVSVVKLVNFLSDLTVRVTVKRVSDQRPDIPYPWYNDTDSKLMRVETGWVDGVEVFKDDICCCRECKKSLKPTTGFAHIVIHTAASLFLGGLDEQHTTRHMFLDFSEAPIVYTDFVTQTEMLQVHLDKTRHTRPIRFLTHNVQLGERLKNMNQKYSHYLFSLTGQEEVSSVSCLQQNGLHIDVSQPEGYGQRVRISCNGDPVSLDTRENLCASTLVNCLGFSGARMIVLARESVHL